MLPYFTRIKRYVIKSTCENFSSFSYFFYVKTVKMHSAAFYSLFENDSTSGRNISRKAFYTIVIFIPCKLCVNLWTFLFWSYQCCAGALRAIAIKHHTNRWASTSAPGALHWRQYTWVSFKLNYVLFTIKILFITHYSFFSIHEPLAYSLFLSSRNTNYYVINHKANWLETFSVHPKEIQIFF